MDAFITPQLLHLRMPIPSRRWRKSLSNRFVFPCQIECKEPTKRRMEEPTFCSDFFPSFLFCLCLPFDVFCSEAQLGWLGCCNILRTLTFNTVQSEVKDDVIFSAFVFLSPTVSSEHLLWLSFIFVPHTMKMETVTINERDGKVSSLNDILQQDFTS